MNDVKARDVLCLLGVAFVATFGCRRMGEDDYVEQVGAAAGEMMASLDESMAGATTIAAVPRLPYPRGVPGGLEGPLWRRALEAVVPSAHAASCWPAPFSACENGVRSRTFDGCSLGPSTLEGTVTLTFTRAAGCLLLAEGDSVTRTADFTLTGPYGGTLAVTSPGGGQTLTRTAGGFEYSVSGMKRVLTGPGGRTWFDVSSRTTAPIVVTGSGRADLVIASGTLEVSHNRAGYKVTLTPANLTWTSSCNCAVSGSLTGTVSGGRLDGKSASVTLTGCGQADLTIDGETESLTFDRCGVI